MAFRKRVFASAFNSNVNRKFKKRKITKRVFKKRRGTGLTSQSGVGSAFGFRSRRVRPRRWRNMLWASTLQRQHYRSNWAVNVNFNTAASVVSAQVRLLNADDNGTAPFWQSLGGAVTPDTGVAVPTFTGDIVLRGAQMGLILGNPTTTLNDGLRFNILLVKSTQDFDTTGFPTSVPIGWDPSLHPDFRRRIGTIMLNRQVLVSQNEVAEIKYRRRIQKIDQGDYAAGVERFYWVVIVSNSYLGSVQDVSVTSYFNGSFSGDAT